MNQAVVITGAAGGIGQALCQLFKEQGYVVIASDRIAAEGLPCDAFVQADLQTLCQVTEYRQQVIQTIRGHLRGEGLHGLINNAAVQIVKATDDLTVEDWHTTLDVNLLAPFLLTQALLPELEQASGSVVNVASIHAQLTKPGFVCYATSKAALVGLTKSMAVDLGPRVRVNTICPAAVETPMLLAGFEGQQQKLRDLAYHHPIQRLAQPIEVAELADFLISGKSSFITGETLSISGGIGGRLYDPV
jgi:NAD(P)-dependent dehydrogenase (short-subunit alcohol dehydrogenase family)